MILNISHIKISVLWLSNHRLYLYSSNSEGCLYILSQPEWYTLWHSQTFTFLKTYIVVNMHNLKKNNNSHFKFLKKH